MVRKFLRVLFVVSLTLNVAFAIHLMRPPVPPTASPARLNLTADQEKRMREIRMEIHRDNEPVKREMALCQDRLMEALRSDRVDEMVVNQCLESIGELQKRIQENSVRELVELKKILNPEQCDCLMEEISSHLSRSTAPCTKPCCNPGQ